MPRHHSLLHLLLRAGRRDTPVSVAARNTAAVAAPLAIGMLLGHRMIGLGVSTGALTTLFADQPGPYRLRLRRMLLFALIAGFAAFVGETLGAYSAALVAIATLWAFGAALLVALGPHATRVGLTSIILLVIMSSTPAPVPLAAFAASLVAAGGILQALFAITAWPLNRYRPERLELAAAFRELRRFALNGTTTAGSRAFPPSLNDLQSFVYGSGRARGRAAEALRVLAELTERIRIELFALADQRAQCRDRLLAEAIAHASEMAASVLESIADALEKGRAPRVESALARYPSAVALVERLAEASADKATLSCLLTLGGQLSAATRTAAVAGSRGEALAETAQLTLPPALRPGNAVATLHANLRFSSSAFRHAVRCGGAVGIAMALERLLSLPHGYWIPMTTAIVLKPDFAATWRYTLLRAAGTLAGLALATAILHLSGIDNLWLAFAVMVVLCFAFRELVAIHYGLAVVCLTGVVVIFLAFYGVPAELSITARAIGTVVGCGLALAAYFLWPTWERGRERATLADLLDAYANYLTAVLCGRTRDYYQLRVDARAARSAAEASLDRLATEPQSRAHFPRAALLIAQANRIVRAAMMLEAASTTDPLPSSSSLAAFTKACNAALRECGRSLRDSRAPRGDFALRSAQRKLAAILPRAADTFSMDVGNATDGITDATNSILHLLGRSWV